MRELKFICAQPDNIYYTWQVHLWLESLKEIGYSYKAIVLVFTPSFREKNDKWQKIVDLYPEAEFVFYKDIDNEVSGKLNTYIPILRPWCLMNYFKEHPEMQEYAVFYCDSDVLFTEKFDISHLLDDDVCYLSDTNNYINASYFDSKMRDVLPEKLEEYKQRDILQEISKVAGISRNICEENNLNSGGAQYLLKNIDYTFWKEMIDLTISIRIYLMTINKEFFKDENTGFQSWCADMWGLLWLLWKRKKETKVIPELDFAWATDPVQKLNRCTIFHNAGVTKEDMEGYSAFYKGKYHRGTDPFEDPNLEKVYNDERSKKYCTHYYVTKMFELKQKYNLNY